VISQKSKVVKTATSKRYIKSQARPIRVTIRMIGGGNEIVYNR